MVMQIAPASILDIGIGFGKFGFLAREYTDVWRGRYHEWKTRIDGIEIYEPYVTELQRMVYDNIYIGNAIEVMPRLQKYDLIICAEMLEHMNEEDGFKLIALIMEKSRFAFISTPKSALVQDAVNGNPYEMHVRQWEPEELKPFGEVMEIKHSMILLMQNP
jgi:2-polyprenyl-3-methyl-5-hydroxy-6-metoxy-1,4-benzoquinol methylase